MATMTPIQGHGLQSLQQAQSQLQLQRQHSSTGTAASGSTAPPTGPMVQAPDKAQLAQQLKARQKFAHYHSKAKVAHFRQQLQEAKASVKNPSHRVETKSKGFWEHFKRNPLGRGLRAVVGFVGHKAASGVIGLGGGLAHIASLFVSAKQDDSGNTKLQLGSIVGAAAYAVGGVSYALGWMAEQLGAETLGWKMQEFAVDKAFVAGYNMTSGHRLTTAVSSELRHRSEQLFDLKPKDNTVSHSEWSSVFAKCFAVAKGAAFMQNPIQWISGSDMAVDGVLGIDIAVNTVGAAMDSLEARRLGKRREAVKNWQAEVQVKVSGNYDTAEIQATRAQTDDVAELAKKNMKQSRRHKMVAATIKGLYIAGAATLITLSALSIVATGPLAPVIAGVALGVALAPKLYQTYKQQGQADAINDLNELMQETQSQIQILQAHHQAQPEIQQITGLDEQISAIDSKIKKLKDTLPIENGGPNPNAIAMDGGPGVRRARELVATYEKHGSWEVAEQKELLVQAELDQANTAIGKLYSEHPQLINDIAPPDVLAQRRELALEIESLKQELQTLSDDKKNMRTQPLISALKEVRAFEAQYGPTLQQIEALETERATLSAERDRLESAPRVQELKQELQEQLEPLLKVEQLGASYLRQSSPVAATQALLEIVKNPGSGSKAALKEAKAFCKLLGIKGVESLTQTPSKRLTQSQYEQNMEILGNRIFQALSLFNTY